MGTAPKGPCRALPQLSQEHLHHLYHVHLNSHWQIRGIIDLGINIVYLKMGNAVILIPHRTMHISAQYSKAMKEKEDMAFGIHRL